jgi:hypothetical protein
MTEGDIGLVGNSDLLNLALAMKDKVDITLSSW